MDDETPQVDQPAPPIEFDGDTMTQGDEVYAES